MALVKKTSALTYSLCMLTSLYVLVWILSLMHKSVHWKRSEKHNSRPTDYKLDHVFIDDVLTTAKAVQPREKNGYLSVINDEPLQYHCNHCALVASSGRLLNKGAGFDIDQGTCVIRMNTAPTEGYEEDVGARTTIRVIGHRNIEKKIRKNPKLQQIFFSDEETRSQLVIVPWLFYDNFTENKNKAFKITKHLSEVYQNVSFYYTTPEKVKLTEKIFMQETGISRDEARTWMSTGLMTMLFAIDICDKIDVYGFSSKDYCSTHPNDSTPYHYFEPDSKKECWYYDHSERTTRRGHRFLTEKAMFARWAKKFNIFFHYPSWKAVVTNGTHVSTPFLKIYDEAKNKGKKKKQSRRRKHKQTND